MSALEETFALIVRVEGLPTPQREYRFDPVRKWRFDFAWPAQKVAVEIDGGVWSGGRHTRGQGFEADAVKLNAAAALGWRVLRFTTGSIANPEYVADIVRRTLEATPS